MNTYEVHFLGKENKRHVLRMHDKNKPNVIKRFKKAHPSFSIVSVNKVEK